MDGPVVRTTSSLLDPLFCPTLSANPCPDPPPPPVVPEHDPYEPLKRDHFDDRYAPPDPTEAQTAFRHSWWSSARERTRRAMVDAKLPAARRLRFQSCGAAALVQVDALSGECRVTACHCHDRWCRACGWTRRQKLARALSGAIGSRRTMMVVLTPVSREEKLGQSLTRLLHDFAKLRKTKLWRRCVYGGAWVFEVTFNATTRLWHPHLHTVVQGDWMPQHLLKDEWRRVTGDSSIVDISHVANNASAITEATKYVGKIAHRSWEHEPELLAEAMRELNGRRLCGTFGRWKNVELQPTCDDVTPRQWVVWGTIDDLFALKAAKDPDALAIAEALATGKPVVIPHPSPAGKNRQRDDPQAGPAPPLSRAPMTAGV